MTQTLQRRERSSIQVTRTNARERITFLHFDNDDLDENFFVATPSVKSFNIDTKLQPKSHERTIVIITSHHMDKSTDSAPKQAMVYICGECHKDNEIRPRDPIRCRECGYRIMYKKRTKRRILFVK
ncbi:hypothetical protein PV325_004188 [Microctonus aethiopoides]|uniref:DNA-directed RNA polymerases I, II, and III subunit RPABC4 n=1 Tax=Microctonus aethiopoides TaxID=144406 RepID=A0AA39FLG3_9HYME|nr:hypothetical protein PV325_004188 [Microctonus aethiopoides]KAK0099038.1 hypothetical protein PV326_009789 [Microctonus aethiopoides]KAK0171795.1 hypothetical protein PV328_005198 [Microctonus aethiopoides]